jgi:rubrerythrin
MAEAQQSNENEAPKQDVAEAKSNENDAPKQDVAEPKSSETDDLKQDVAEPKSSENDDLKQDVIEVKSNENDDLQRYQALLSDLDDWVSSTHGHLRAELPKFTSVSAVLKEMDSSKVSFFLN